MHNILQLYPKPWDHHVAVGPKWPLLPFIQLRQSLESQDKEAELKRAVSGFLTQKAQELAPKSAVVPASLLEPIFPPAFPPHTVLPHPTFSHPSLPQKSYCWTFHIVIFLDWCGSQGRHCILSASTGVLCDGCQHCLAQDCILNWIKQKVFKNKMGVK